MNTRGAGVFLAILAVVLLGVGVWLYREWRKTGRGGEASHVKRLRREYERLTGLRGAAAYESLERKLERHMRESPGQPMEVYLDAIVKELRRDKR